MIRPKQNRLHLHRVALAVESFKIQLIIGTKFCGYCRENTSPFKFHSLLFLRSQSYGQNVAGCILADACLILTKLLSAEDASFIGVKLGWAFMFDILRVAVSKTLK